MKKNFFFFLLFLFCLLISGRGHAQGKLQSPDQFLGYPLGTRFTPHHRVVAYFEYLSRNAPNLKLQQYGASYEGRPLLLAVVSSKTNIDRLEAIRINNLRSTGLAEGNPEPTGGTEPVIVWLSYNVHGNESVSTEASMQTIYALLTKASQQWLDNAVVIIDPCLNPDGRDRYVNWYTQMLGRNPNVLPAAREHYEPWPGGRYNHYLFDLNRDWAWQSQQETQQRLQVYHQWMPHVHADFHEMGVDNPYYFAPAAEPYHREITPWQREFQVSIGRNHARYFDQNNWLYFTREVFDLLYPSYGDSWPMFNGAVAMTYEQGGSGRAGLGIITSSGDTLTLGQRIAHHHTVGLSTVEAAANNREKVLSEFRSYYERNRNNPTGTYKTYVIRGTNPVGKLRALRSYLDRQQIRYGYASAIPKPVKGYNYITGNTETFTLQPSDMVVSAYQPKSVMVKVLFDPRNSISDSVTYDATAWALPYSYGLESYAISEKLEVVRRPENNALAPPMDAPYAYLAEWNSFTDLRFLVQLLNNDVKVRFTEKEFELNNKKYAPGTLIIARADNMALGAEFDQLVINTSLSLGKEIDGATTGMVSKGVDFGSSSVHFIKKPRIALLSGSGIVPTAFGELWHFFEEQLGYPVTAVNLEYFNRVNLNDFDVLVFPQGYYGNEVNSAQLKQWVQQGGKVVALENANNLFTTQKEFGLRKKSDEEGAPKADGANAAPAKKEKEDPALLLKKYGNREREALSESVEGSIFKVHLDNTHPLAFGYGEIYFTLRRTADQYEYFKENGWNVGVIKENAFVDGFTGYKIKQKLRHTLVFGVQEVGRGNVIHLVDNPVFRSSWENGKLLFGNALFMVGN